MAKQKSVTAPAIGVAWSDTRDGRPLYRVAVGFADADEARRYAGWSGRNATALRSRNSGEIAVIEVEDLAVVLSEGEEDRTAEWQAFDAKWRAEKRQEEEDARKAHEAKLAAEEAARREAEIQRLIDLQLKRELEERKARWRAAAEAELEHREQGDAA
jgi:hypothetical protein